MNSSLTRLKDRLSRQSTWSAIGVMALALVPVVPAAAAALTAIAGVSGGIKLLLPEDSTLPKADTGTPSGDGGQ